LLFSDINAWHTCSSAHTSIPHPLLAHHHLCFVNDCDVYYLTFAYPSLPFSGVVAGGANAPQKF